MLLSEAPQVSLPAALCEERSPEPQQRAAAAAEMNRTGMAIALAVIIWATTVPGIWDLLLLNLSVP